MCFFSLIPKNKILCEPQMGKRGLYPTLSTKNNKKITRHYMDSEYFSVPPDTAELINKSREKDRRIITVGTSTIRTLETVVVSGFQITPRSGWTDKFIYPPYQFKMSDMLITNFHQPQSTLMMLVSAYANKDFIMHAYQEAIKKKYRFYSYGDAMLIM